VPGIARAVRDEGIIVVKVFGVEIERAEERVIHRFLIEIGELASW